MKETLDSASIANQDATLCQVSGEAFFDSSPFTLKYLKNWVKLQQLKADFEAYLDGLSQNVQEILDKLKFRNQILTLVEMLMATRRYLGWTITAWELFFEELIRRFNEENNEEAGEHFTPRDVVKLMADLIFLPIADQIESGTYLVYDRACGIGGMLTVAEESLQKLDSDAAMLSLRLNPV
jgi:type I restriction enzyme M protein